jgi:hypothetical protein
MQSDFWVITSYFNPLGYQSRRENFFIFASALKKKGIPLLVVELAQNENLHELTSDCADLYVPLTHDTIFWHQESLLNIALDKLPESCQFVARVDCDILFLSDSWVDDTRKKLDTSDACYLYEWVIRCQKGMTTVSEPMKVPIGYGEGRRAYSLAALHERAPRLRELFPFAETGFALGFRLDFIRNIRFFDLLPFGGADTLLAHSLLFGNRGLSDNQVFNNASPQLQEAILEWTKNIAGNLSFIPGVALHLYHGDIQNRGYSYRLKQPVFQCYNPSVDLTRNAIGLLQFKSENSALENKIRHYFAKRNEDGSRHSILSKVIRHGLAITQNLRGYKNELPQKSLTFLHELITNIPTLFFDSSHVVVWLYSKEDENYLDYKSLLLSVFGSSNVRLIEHSANDIPIDSFSEPTTYITAVRSKQSSTSLINFLNQISRSSASLIWFFQGDKPTLTEKYAQYCLELSTRASVLLVPNLASVSHVADSSSLHRNHHES